MVADSLKDYLLRHPDMEQRLLKKGRRKFFTTDNPNGFDAHAPVFYGEHVKSEFAELRSS